MAPCFVFVTHNFGVAHTLFSTSLAIALELASHSDLFLHGNIIITGQGFFVKPWKNITHTQCLQISHMTWGMGHSRRSTDIPCLQQISIGDV